MIWPGWSGFSGGIARLAVVTMLAAPMLAAPRAGGQSSPDIQLPPGFDEVLRPDFVRRDLQVMTTTLQLDEVQQTILEQLFLDYEVLVGAGNEAIQEEIRERTSELIAEQVATQNERRKQYRAEMSTLVKDIRERQKQNKDARNAQVLRDEFRRRAEELRSKMQEPTATASVRVTREFFETIEQWRLDKSSLGESLLDGVRAILTLDQAERWPALERQLNRQKQLGRGQLSGESLNLITLIQEVGVDEVARASLRVELQEYELALDAALRERSRRLVETRRSLMEAVVAQDDRRISAAVDRQIEAHAAVRQVNDRYLELIVAALPSADGARLQLAARRRVHPRLFTPTGSTRALAKSLALPDLPPDKRATIEQLAESYRVELDAIAVELIRRYRSHEPAELAQSIRKRWGISPGPPLKSDAGVAELLNRRRRLDVSTTDQLRGHLTARQAERVLGPSGD